MGIYRYKNKYRVEIRMFSKVDGINHRFTEVCETHKEAQALQDKIKTKIREGKMGQGGDMKLHVWLNKYLELKKVDLSPTTYKGYSFIINRIPKNILNTKLEKLKEATFSDMLQEFKIKYAHNTVLNTYKFLSKAMNQAWRRNMTQHDLFKGIDKPSKDKKDIEIMKSKEVDAFLDMLLAKKNQKLKYGENKGEGAFVYHQNYLFFNLALATGMRRGELAGLKWSNIDLDNKKIKVSCNLIVDASKNVLLKSPKNGKTRTIDIDDATVRKLRNYKSRISKLVIKYNWQDKISDFVFINLETGDVTNPNLWTNRFKYYMRKLNIKGQRLHNLRHTHISLLLNNGFMLMYVSHRAGHSDMSTTARIYAKFIEDQHEGYYEKMLINTGLQLGNL